MFYRQQREVHRPRFSNKNEERQAPGSLNRYQVCNNFLPKNKMHRSQRYLKRLSHCRPLAIHLGYSSKSRVANAPSRSQAPGTARQPLSKSSVLISPRPGTFRLLQPPPLPPHIPRPSKTPTLDTNIPPTPPITTTAFTPRYRHSARHPPLHTLMVTHENELPWQSHGNYHGNPVGTTMGCGNSVGITMGYGNPVGNTMGYPT